MKYKILAAILALVAVTSLAAAQQPSISVSDQDIINSTVVVDSVTANQTGWVVIHLAAAEVAGQQVPGRSIGAVDVGEGTTEDISIPIDPSRLQEGDNDLVAMLHVDDPADGAFTFPNGDLPVTIDNRIVQQSFIATLPAAAVTPTEEVTPVVEETPVEAETPVEVVTPSPAAPGLTGLMALGVLGAVAYLMKRK